MPESRTFIRHLFENMRDSYPCTLGEAILTELMANALDSRCSAITILCDPDKEVVTLIDDGEGMKEDAFKQYHDIACTTKARGTGIGFAGQGAKLALLACSEVHTETKRGPRRYASRWRLESDYKARWEWTEPLGMVKTEKGTAVRLLIKGKAADELLLPDLVKEMIQKHFYPLLDEEFSQVLHFVYPKGVVIQVNGYRVALPEMKREATKYFQVYQGKRKKLAGHGFIVKVKKGLPEGQEGLAVSTYGKVIKRGWEWLKVSPKNPANLAGVVEVPELVEILTTNKCDFLGDTNSVSKYNACRKAVQAAVVRVLEDMGESRPPEPKADKGLEKLQKEIDRVLGEILPDFPELAPLFGRKKSGEQVPALLSDLEGAVVTGEAQGADVGTGDVGGRGEGEGVEGAIEGPLEGAHLEEEESGGTSAREHTSRRKRPGLMINYDRDTDGDAFGWLRESTLYVNALHPAYKRVENTEGATPYVVFATALTLLEYVQEGRSPLNFMQTFMAKWGASE